MVRRLRDLSKVFLLDLVFGGEGAIHSEKSQENCGEKSAHFHVYLATPLASYRWEMSPKSEMAEKLTGQMAG